MAETGRKNQTLRIAVGVFLGVLAALIVYHVPAWVKQHAAEEAQAKQNEIDSRLMEMKPMDFVARCGDLVKDKTEGLGGGMATRDVTVRLSAPNGATKKVTASWTLMPQPSGADDPSNWVLNSVGGIDAGDDITRPLIESEYSCTVNAQSLDDGLELLTPDQVIRACGKPVQDKTADDGQTTTRFLVFQIPGSAESKRKVTAVFENGTLSYFGGLSTWNDSAALVEKWYPCLKPSNAGTR